MENKDEPAEPETLEQRIFKVAQGFPGAIKICKEVSQNFPGSFDKFVKNLITFNVKGETLCCLFEHICRSKPGLLVFLVLKMDARPVRCGREPVCHAWNIK